MNQLSRIIIFLLLQVLILNSCVVLPTTPLPKEELTFRSLALHSSYSWLQNLKHFSSTDIPESVDYLISKVNEVKSFMEVLKNYDKGIKIKG